MSERNLSEIVKGINEQLRAHGKNAVQEVKMTDREGKTIGQIKYGYRPQYVFDAINEMLFPENWRYEVLTKEIYETQAVVEVKLFIRCSGEWFCKGSQVGQMNIVKGNVGDAYKGAITDAIQKNFSLLSIAQDAYRGLLKQVFLGTSSAEKPAAPRPPARQTAKPEKPPVKPALSETPANEIPLQQPASLESPPSASAESQQEPPEPQDQQQSPENPDLPQIAGINFQRVEDRFIATGKVYDKKELLKSAGFKWDGGGKNWFKEANAATN